MYQLSIKKREIKLRMDLSGSSYRETWTRAIGRTINMNYGKGAHLHFYNEPGHLRFQHSATLSNSRRLVLSLNLINLHDNTRLYSFIIKLKVKMKNDFGPEVPRNIFLDRGNPASTSGPTLFFVTIQKIIFKKKSIFISI